MTVLLKRSLKPRHLLLSQRKQNKLPGKRTRDIKIKAMIQRINCYHKTIVAKKLMKNHLVQQTLQLQHAAQLVKVIGRFQNFCQVTTHVTSGCPLDFMWIFVFFTKFGVAIFIIKDHHLVTTTIHFFTRYKKD